MKRFTRPIHMAQMILGSLGLLLVLRGTAGAQAGYQIQPIVKFGDHLGDLVIGGHLDVAALNDNRQIAFVAGNPNGDEMLFQYADGKLTPIVVPGRDAPGGKWGTDNGVEGPVSMNQFGNIVFATDVVDGRKAELGTYLWEYQTQKITPLALRGMPAGNNLTLVTGGESTPAINNRGEVALVANVKNPAGQALPGVFFRGTNSQLLPVALPGQPLPGDQLAVHAHEPAINDAGAMTVLVRKKGDGAEQDSAYLWENGALTSLALIGEASPSGQKFAAIWRAHLNNKNRNVLIAGRLGNQRGQDALYLYTGGKLAPVLLPGQLLPDGGKFKTLQSDREGVGTANGAGQHPILVFREDGSTAAYRVDADGSLSLILASGAMTTQGKITHVGVPTPSDEPQGVGIALNSGGQVALSVRVNGGPTTLVLLTPTTP